MFERAPDAAGPEPAASPTTPTVRPNPFGARAYLARRLAEFADGPTMAELVAEADRCRERPCPR